MLVFTHTSVVTLLVNLASHSRPCYLLTTVFFSFFFSFHSLHDYPLLISFFFFFNDTATTEIYTLSLHDALPILTAYAHLKKFNQEINKLAREEQYRRGTYEIDLMPDSGSHPVRKGELIAYTGDRKSTRLNSSHGYISYAVFCLKKKNT